MPHLELGSDHTTLHKAGLIHNAKEAEDEEARNFSMTAMEPAVPPRKREPKPLAPEVTYEPEDITEDPRYHKFLETNNDALVSLIDSWGGMNGYIKKIEEFYKNVKDAERGDFVVRGIPLVKRDFFNYIRDTSRYYLIPMYNLTQYHVSPSLWHKRVLGYIEALKNSEIEVEAPPPPPPKKVKKITISGVRYSYKEGKIDGGNVLIIYKGADEKLETPLGYYKWDMEKNRPSGKMIPMPPP
jgi:hypothetical protein